MTQPRRSWDGRRPSSSRRPTSPKKLAVLLLLAATAAAATSSTIGVVVSAHEYLHVPPARTGDCTLNGILMGERACRDVDPNDDGQCLADRTVYSHLFRVHPAYSRSACGGSTEVVGSYPADDGGGGGGGGSVTNSSSSSQGLLQDCGDVTTNPERFDASIWPGPEGVTTYEAGSDVTLTLRGFFHAGAMRVSLCYLDDYDHGSTDGESNPESTATGTASGDDADADRCSSPSHFERYVLGYHFTEGITGKETDPEGIYSVELNFEVRMPARPGRAVLQWLAHAEDVRSYVSCSSVEIVVGGGGGAMGPPLAERGRMRHHRASPATTATNRTSADAAVMADLRANSFEHEGGGGGGIGHRGDAWYCNGHPLCNCTTSEPPGGGGSSTTGVGLGATCPQGTAPSVTPSGGSSGTDIVEQYKAQLGVEEFCALCITDGCPSTCGGRYDGFYQGPRCTNEPVVGGCGSEHASALPRFVECTGTTCEASGWSPSPSPPAPPAPGGDVSEVELEARFKVRTRPKYKPCGWIAERFAGDDGATRAKYCRNRASARSACPASCSEGGCARSSAAAEDGGGVLLPSSSSPECDRESSRKFVHRKGRGRSRTCGWLRESSRREAICRRYAGASASCPTVCSYA